MNCGQLRDHYDLFAMGVADAPETEEIRQHLDRGCEVCMAEVRRSREFTALLGGSAAPAVPSPKLRRRILASVGHEEKRFGWTPFLAAAMALSLCAAVYFSGRERGVAEEARQLRAMLRSQRIELTRLTEAFAILSGPQTTVTSFGAGQPQPPKGKVFVNPSLGVLLIASNLPPAPAGKRYEMWVIPKGANPIPAGLFQSQGDGTAMHIQRGPVDPNAGTVAVTMENEAGSATPTMPILIAAPLQ